MAAMTVICADTDEEAELLASARTSRSCGCAAAIRASCRRRSPVIATRLPISAQAMLEHLGQARAVGSPATVRAAIGRFVERTRADEIIVSGATYDPAARGRSLELTMEALADRRRLSVVAGAARLRAPCSAYRRQMAADARSG